MNACAVLPGLLGERAREQLACRRPGSVRRSRSSSARRSWRPPLAHTASTSSAAPRTNAQRGSRSASQRPSGPAAARRRRRAVAGSSTRDRAGRAASSGGGRTPALRARARATRHEQRSLVLEQRPQPRAGRRRAQRPRIVARPARPSTALADPRAGPPRDRPGRGRREQPVLGAALGERARRAPAGAPGGAAASTGRRSVPISAAATSSSQLTATTAPRPSPAAPSTAAPSQGHRPSRRRPRAASARSPFHSPKTDDRAAAGEREQPPAGPLGAAERQRAVGRAASSRSVAAVGDRGARARPATRRATGSRRAPPRRVAQRLLDAAGAERPRRVVERRSVSPATSARSGVAPG